MVVNDLTRTDQDFIRNLTKERSKRENTCKEIFILHNLKAVQTEDEFTRIWEELRNLYDGKEDTAIAQEGAPKYFHCPNLNTRHVCLLDDNSPFGKQHNDIMFNLVRSWIDGILLNSAIPEEDRFGLKPLENLFNTLVPFHIDNVQTVQFIDGVFKANLVPEKKGNHSRP